MLQLQGTGLIVLLGATALVSAALVRLSITYAHRRALIDQPGRRRSHRVPTPRGGGVAIVASALGAMLLLPAASLPAQHLQVTAAIVLVTTVGWADDHRDLHAAWRFAAHCVAALLVVLAWLPASAVPGLPWLPAAGTVALATLGVAWSINLHNFMDGIDGLLAWQAIFVFVLLALLGWHAGELAQARVLALWAAATAGFLPFNFPHARVFMGDVGSAALGLVIAAGLLWLARQPGILAIGLVACSAFVVDASCTLLSRLVRGRRWYSAHREHLYQWLVRRGLSHARVVLLYMGWNLLVVVPVIVILQRVDPIAQRAAGITCVIAVYAAGIALWWAGKRACLRRLRQERSACCAS